MILHHLVCLLCERRWASTSVALTRHGAGCPFCGHSGAVATRQTRAPS